MAKMNELLFMMSKVKQIKTLLLLMFLFITLSLLGRTVEAAETDEPVTDIKYYKTNNKTNQIPYFDNRFRIDAEIKELTLLFYRERGARPVILVRPDGSKLRTDNFPEDRVEWYDDTTFDMIKIKNPMPGPWQVVGKVLPDSQIMVITEVEIAVEPLPEVMISGETLKIKAKLFNQKKAIDTPAFRAVVSLDVDFLSTNNPDYYNYGAEPVQLTTFKDDGKNLDEYARDGVFTGEFELTIPAGEWIPVYSVDLPMAKRELQQKAVILQPNPISISVVPTNKSGEFHKIILTISDAHVDVDSVVFQGKVIFPGKQEDPFSIADSKGKERSVNIGYLEAGIHNVIVNAYGRTNSGREFRMVVPNFTFNVEENISEVPSGTDNEGLLSIIELEEETARLKALAFEENLAVIKQKAEDKKQNIIIFIVVGNIIIIVVSLVIFFFVRKGRSKKKTKIKVKKEKKKKETK